MRILLWLAICNNQFEITVWLVNAPLVDVSRVYESVGDFLTFFLSFKHILQLKAYTCVYTEVAGLHIPREPSAQLLSCGKVQSKHPLLLNLKKQTKYQILRFEHASWACVTWEVREKTATQDVSCLDITFAINSFSDLKQGILHPQPRYSPICNMGWW